VLTLAALAAVPASASVIVRLDVGALTAQADVIVRGRVVAERSRWDGRRTRIVTDVWLLVAQTYRGRVAAGEVITVTRLGGSVDGIGMRVAGEATFDVGEEAVVFLRRHGAGALARHTVVGMAQGKLTVVRSPDAAHVLASPGAAGLRLVTPDGGRLQPVTPRGALQPLGDVERAIAAALAPPPRRTPARAGGAR
jgi:hypothetical protein